MKIGICGCGFFSHCFIPLFITHPLVEEVILTDLVPERTAALAKENNVQRTVSSFEEMLETDVDAVAIFTQRQLHGPMALQALAAGKHVYCAVPMGAGVDEIARIVQAVSETGLLYMMGETSYYYPSALFCRAKFRNGKMGKFVYAEAQYMHDMDHFYEPYQHSGGADWKRVAGLPPMYYPTHSTSLILSVTGAKAETVSCLGYKDSHADGIFRRGANHWDNEFSNECALLRTSDGGVIRLNEMRRIGYFGGNSVYMSFYGEQAGFEQNAISACFVHKDKKIPPQDITDLLKCRDSAPLVGLVKALREKGKTGEEFYTGVSQLHQTSRLPNVYKGLFNGHYGSHQFLVDDFVTGLAKRTLPPCNAWNAARWNIPGLIAHQSALAGGKMMTIPDLGDVPESYPFKDS